MVGTAIESSYLDTLASREYSEGVDLVMAVLLFSACIFVWCCDDNLCTVYRWGKNRRVGGE